MDRVGILTIKFGEIQGLFHMPQVPCLQRMTVPKMMPLKPSGVRFFPLNFVV